MLDNELKQKIKNLWNKFWSGGMANPLVSIEQISYLLFMKRIEDEDILKQQNSEFTTESYISIFSENDDCRWSIWTQYSATKILNHVRNKVFPFLQTLGDDDSLYNQYMSDAVFIIPTASLLIEAVKIIDDMQIKYQNRDTQGDIYEYLLSELTISGKNGQFRTPRHIIKMMVNLVNPQIGELICDPACGTAGFLIIAYEHILFKNTSKNLIQTDDSGVEYNFIGDKISIDQWNFLREDAFYGYDNDSTMVRIALMNLMMHGISEPNVKRMNTISRRFTEENYYDLVLANPPFTGSLDESDLSDQFTIKSKKTEILFVELMYRLMRIGGRCAVIVPEGIIFGSSRNHIRLKKLLIENCRLDAVISMPNGVFRPYSGVATSVLIFTKGEKTEKIWFYEMKSDGYTLDDKRTFIDGKGEIPDIIQKFDNRYDTKEDDRTGTHFFIPINEIIENDYNLSINRYKEYEYEKIEYEDPKQIKQEVINIESEILGLLKDIDIE